MSFHGSTFHSARALADNPGSTCTLQARAVDLIQSVDNNFFRAPRLLSPYQLLSTKACSHAAPASMPTEQHMAMRDISSRAAQKVKDTNMPQRASRWSLYLRTADGASSVPLQPRSSDAAAAGSGKEVHGEVLALHGALHALWHDLHATLKVSC